MTRYSLGDHRAPEIRGDWEFCAGIGREGRKYHEQQIMVMDEFRGADSEEGKADSREEEADTDEGGIGSAKGSANSEKGDGV
jgi:hypothetical protein